MCSISIVCNLTEFVCDDEDSVCAALLRLLPSMQLFLHCRPAQDYKPSANQVVMVRQPLSAASD